MKVLIVAAHPDDEVIICGATIDKLIKRGDEVHVAYCSLNEEAYFGTETSEDRAKRTMVEAKSSASFLGFSCSFLGFKDMHLEENIGLLIKSIIKEIRSFEPDVIVSHFSKDKHIDHRTLGGMVAEANFQSGCNLCGGDKVWKAKIVLQGEVDLEMTNSFNFQVVSAVTEENVNRKLEAFKFYESVKEEHSTTQEWLFKKLEIVASLRGKAVDEEFGEAFIIDNYSPLSGESLGILTKMLNK